VNLLIELVGLTLETQTLSILTTLEPRMWNWFSWSRHTNHSFLFLRLWIFFVGLAVSSKP